MTYTEISAALQDRILTVVAEATGVHRDTLQAIRNGTANPTERTLAKLRTYLGAKE